MSLDSFVTYVLDPYTLHRFVEIQLGEDLDLILEAIAKVQFLTL